MVISADGHLYAWGRGFADVTNANSPMCLISSLQFSRVVVGRNHILLLTGVFFLFPARMACNSLQLIGLHCSIFHNNDAIVNSMLISFSHIFDRWRRSLYGGGRRHGVLSDFEKIGPAKHSSSEQVDNKWCFSDTNTYRLRNSCSYSIVMLSTSQN